jgi:hypothetical protein
MNVSSDDLDAGYRELAALRASGEERPSRLLRENMARRALVQATATDTRPSRNKIVKSTAP